LNLTKNGLIVIISLVFVAGLGTAYAGTVLPTITLGGNVVVTGETELDGDLHVGTSDDSDDDAIWFDDDTKFLRWSEFFNGFIFNDDLEIGGNLETTGDVIIQGSLTCPGGCVGTGDIVDGQVTSADIASNVQLSGDVRIDSNTFAVDSANNKIGMGTFSPPRKLTVIDNVPQLRLGQSVSNAWDLWGGVDLNFQKGGDTKVFFKDNGNVGIGTTTPMEKLDVNGVILGTPIVGRWAPDSHTPLNGGQFVVFDIQFSNTDPSYFGFTPGQDHIKILKSGIYEVTAHVQLEFPEYDIGPGQVQIDRVNSNYNHLETLCQSNFDLPTSERKLAYSCSSVAFFEANQMVLLDDVGGFNILGSPLGKSTFVMIKRLN